MADFPLKWIKIGQKRPKTAKKGKDTPKFKYKRPKTTYLIKEAAKNPPNTPENDQKRLFNALNSQKRPILGQKSPILAC